MTAINTQGGERPSERDGKRSDGQRPCMVMLSSARVLLRSRPNRIWSMCLTARAVRTALRGALLLTSEWEPGQTYEFDREPNKERPWGLQKVR